MSNWYVYIIRDATDRFYTGISTDPNRRFVQHSRQKGARYFRFAKPQEILYCEECLDRSTALKREAAIKKMRRIEKIALIGRI